MYHNQQVIMLDKNELTQALTSINKEKMKG